MKIWQRLFVTVVFAAFALCGAAGAGAQQVEIASSPNPVGSGARANGMGGAFIGVADDATAASWNPGGLIQLETPEVSVVGSYYMRTEKYASDLQPGAARTGNDMDSTNLNYFSVAYPFALFDRNMVVSLNYQHLYDFNKEIEFEQTLLVGGVDLVDRERFTQDGGLWTISPAAAVQLTPGFSVGFTLNFWEDFIEDSGWKNETRTMATGTLAGYLYDVYHRSRSEFSFSGFNMHFGFLWDINQMFTLGGVYKTAFDADVHRKVQVNESFQYRDPSLPPDLNWDSEKSWEEDLDLRMPRSYGLGLAVRFSDSFTVDVDVYRTEWGTFVLTDSEGRKISPVTAQYKWDSDVGPTHQIRIGGEYLFIRQNSVIPVRAGVFYDPEPARHSPEDFYGFSIGSGFVWKSVVLDGAYQFRWGSDVDGDAVGVPGTTADVRQHLVLLSAIVHF